MMNPERANILEWAHSLIIDFPNDDIPLLENELGWRKWGDLLVQENSFSRSAAPGTGLYSDWLPWARNIYYAMANF